MQNSITFSIIIPLYNGAKFIEKTLASVFQQSCQDYEIIIVNDGSSDDSEKIIKQILKDRPDKKIVYTRQENRGLGGARNTALRQARGRIIALLDQDDSWRENKLAKTLEVFNNNQEIMVVCHDVELLKKGKLGTIFHVGPNSQDTFRQLLFGGCCLTPSAVSFRREIVNNVGFFSEDLDRDHLIEDYDYWLRIAKKKYIFYFLPQVLGECQIHEHSQSLKELLPINERALNLVERVYQNYQDKKRFDFLRLKWSKARRLISVFFRLFL